MANRILTVGSHGRAKMLSQFLDEVKVEITSPRGFSTYTGLYRGVRNFRNAPVCPSVCQSVKPSTPPYECVRVCVRESWRGEKKRVWGLSPCA